MLDSKKIYKLFKNRIFTTIFLSFIILLFLSFSIVFKLLYSQDRNLDRAIQTSFNPNIKFTKNVSVIAIDENTLEHLWRFPFNREIYIPLIKNLNNLWVSVIWFDIIFSDKTDKKIDKKFAWAIKNAWNVVLAWIDERCDKIVNQKSIKDLKKWECLKNSQWSLKMPLDSLNNASFTSWYFSPIVEMLQIEYIVLSLKPHFKIMFIIILQ